MIYRYDILSNKCYPVDKTWTYKINIADEFYLGEEEIETSKTSFYIKNEMLRQDNFGNMFLSVEFSKMEFDCLPKKLTSFLNKIIKLNDKYVLQLNKEGQIVEIQLSNDKHDTTFINDIYSEEFYENLNEDEKLIINKNVEKLDKIALKKDLKKNFILLFCYPGYFRTGLSDNFAIETHNHTINSNFLKDVNWDVQFDMSIHNITSNKQINLICTGNVYEGTNRQESVLYQKIQNYFEAEENEVYTDYTFEVMCDYTLSGNNYLIEKATIDICETLNNEEIEFNKNIQIELVDEFKN